ncbi:MAG: hypothetical protein Q9160_005634 [Pyrenula sp. 1 TL-2023]
MSNNNSPPATPPSPQRRRSSIVDFISSGFSNPSANNQNNGTPAVPGTIASAAQAQQNRRRVSINTMGMNNSPPNASSFNAFSRRRASISSSNSSSSPVVEEAVVEENENPGPTNTPASPFARRVSFGAQAYRDIRSGSVSGNNGSNGSGRPSLGFNWSESMRDKAGRPPATNFGSSPTSGNNAHQRSSTVAVMEPPKQMPPASTLQQKPDVLGERMLRGDFMMD